MSQTIDELKTLLSGLDLLRKNPLAEIDPSEVVEKSTAIINLACATNGEYDINIEGNPQKVASIYSNVADVLADFGLFYAAENLLIDAWNAFARKQSETGKRIYRAGIAAKLTNLYRSINDKGASLRWALLTHADDKLGRHKKGGAGKQILTTVLGMNQNALQEFDLIAESHLEKAEKDWSSVFGFAEHIVLRFAIEKRDYSYLITEQATIREFPICGSYLMALLERVRDSEATNKNKGVSLEDLASYLFLLIPSCIPSRNLIKTDKAFENDIVISNLNPSSNLISEILGRHFLVECKNRKKRVDARDVGYFLYRMRLTHSTFGIIFSKTGITGKNTAADSLRTKAFHEDRSVCIVLDQQDLEKLTSEKISFWSMILERIETMRFGSSQ